MEFILILGPMKSGKSFDLINYFSPLKYTNESFALYQPERNVRDEGICSRDGIQLDAKKVPNLKKALEDNFSVVGIDEMHMFDKEDILIVKKLLQKGVKVIISGLDTDYRGKMFDVIKKLLELGPSEVRYKRAVCENCKKHNAVYTQIFKDSTPVTRGLPPVCPDDGTFVYKTVCRNCFITE